MPPPSQARQFFESIVSDPDPIAAVRRLINADPPTPETDWLDFKTEHPTDPKQRDRKNREYWSEDLTGFANNQGGVLIWGVDARRSDVGGREIDHACGEKPIADPVGLAAKMVDWQRQATDPPLSNVEVKPLPFADDPMKGFVVCFVPEGPFKPYRSEQTSDKQWYLRAGCNTVVMSPAVLRSMFFPKSSAVFQFDLSLTATPSPERTVGGDSTFILRLDITIGNEGTATAKDLWVNIASRLPGFNEAKVPSNNRFDCVQNNTRKVLVSRTPLHPGHEFVVCSASWTVNHAETMRLIHFGTSVVPIEIAAFCENHTPQRMSAEIGLEELLTSRYLGGSVRQSDDPPLCLQRP